TISFITNFPDYIKIVESSVDDMLSNPLFSQVQEQLEASWEKIFTWMTEIIQKFSKSTFENIGNFFGAVASVFIAIVTMTFILFYLLKDGKNLAPYAVAFLPTK